MKGADMKAEFDALEPLSEEDRQAIILALVELSQRRAGWSEYLRDISKKFGGEDIFDALIAKGCDPQNEEQHRLRHVMLHHRMDELMADYIEKQDGSIYDPMADLMKWSYEQTFKPQTERYRRPLGAARGKRDSSSFN
jgi:hypothetical protein